MHARFVEFADRYSLAVSGAGGREVRGLRAVVATLVVVALASYAHTAAGGPVLRPVAAVVLFVLVGPLVWLVLHVRTSVARMVLATGAGQVVTHLALVGMQPSTGGTAAIAGHAHQAVIAPAGAPPPAMALHVSVSMVLAHVLATVVASVLLCVGEDVARSVVRRLAVVVQPVLVRRGTRPVPGANAVRRLTGRGVLPLGGRAPPLYAC